MSSTLLLLSLAFGYSFHAPARPAAAAPYGDPCLLLPSVLQTEDGLLSVGLRDTDLPGASPNENTSAAVTGTAVAPCTIAAASWSSETSETTTRDETGEHHFVGIVMNVETLLSFASAADASQVLRSSNSAESPVGAPVSIRADVLGSQGIGDEDNAAQLIFIQPADAANPAEEIPGPVIEIVRRGPVISIVSSDDGIDEAVRLSRLIDQRLLASGAIHE